MASNHIIISLDDFGISQKANINFLELLKTKKINRVSVMVNGQISKDEAQALLDSGAKLDIHLDIHGRICQKRKFKKNAFESICSFIFNYFSNFFRAKRIEKIWEEQIKKFIEIFGKNPDGINSHQYAHLFPSYFALALKIAQKYEIKFIRFGKMQFEEKNTVSRVLNVLRRMSMKSFKKSSLETSDFLVSFDWIKDFEKFQANLSQEKSAEIIFHPERDTEYAFLQKFLS